MATASFAAERTISGEYHLASNEDWSEDMVTLAAGAMVDLNGFNLRIGAVATSGSSAGFTNTADMRSELCISIPKDSTFAKTADLEITGNLSLVKDGAGLFSWNGGTLAAGIPITISDGVFKLGVTTANVFGSSGTITVNGTGQFDLNYSVENKDSPVRNKMFYIEGEGPDGSGAIVNNATGKKYGNHLNDVVMTGDATIGGISRIDFRGSNNGIDGEGYTLTIKNTDNLVFASGTHLTCKDVVATEGGSFQPCSGCVMNVSGTLYIARGGVFANFSSRSVTQHLAFPVVVDNDGGVIRSANYWFQLNGPLTVKSGSSLSCTTIAPWYAGAITNETGATLNISGEFSAMGGIFRNDGTVNHTAAKFVLGHRDNVNPPCAVENNGIILTSGGTFIFKAESSMTGTGTLELAGGSPSVAGKLSGFTGMIRVSGATATINNIATFPGTLVLANGTVSTSLSGVTCPVVFDLSGKTAPFTIPPSWLTLPSGKSVTVNLDGRNLSSGEQLIAWTETPDLEFSLDEASSQRGGRILRTDDGLYYAVGDVVITSALWTGEANDGDFSNPGNWSCRDQDGNIIPDVIPSAGITVTLNADVASAWSQFDLSEGRRVDLNGHRLVLGIESDSAVNLIVVDTSTDEENPGELCLMIDSGVTFTRTDSLAISGNLSLVKDGPGTFVWGGGTLAATIPVSVMDGVFKIGATTGNLFGASGTVTVKAPGQFDINTAQQYGPVRARTFYIEGDGPDGSGAIVNSAANTPWGYHLNKIVLIGNATIGGIGSIEIRDSGNGIDCGGYELTVKNTGRLLVEAGTHLTDASDIVIDGGRLQVCNSCELGADRIVLQNGGTFENYMSTGTREYDVPFFVRTGSEISAVTNTITTSKNDFSMNKAITVESGAVLSLPKGGPWYAGFTNKTDATIVVSGGEVCLTADSIFKNDGILDHIGGKLYVGHRDDDIGACTVENNGLIRSAGGEFVFKTQSSMIGNGTLELAGGLPQVLGDLSGFRGRVVVSNGVAVTFADMNCGGTVAVYENSTLTVDAESESATRVANMIFEAGSVLNIANYNGATPIEVAESIILPSDGTVNLKLNGGVFAEGIYTICKMNGVTEEDGKKFTPLTSTDDLEIDWSVVDNNTLVLTVGTIDSYAWTGSEGDGNLSSPGNWYGGKVPTCGTATINCTAATTLTVGDTFSADVIVFLESCQAVNITGERSITGLKAITNLSSSVCTFEVPVKFVNEICVSQGAYYSFASDGPVLYDGGKVRFVGGVTGTSFAEGTSRRLDGAFTIPATANWTANTSDKLWTVTDDSSLTITGSSAGDLEATDLSYLNNNGAFTTAVIRTSSRICLRNEGEYIVTEELAMTLPGKDLHIDERPSESGKYKIEKVTLGDNGDRGNYYMDKNVYIGAGGLCFADGAQQYTAYAFGRRPNDKIYIYPWYSDYTIGAKGGTTRDIIIIKPTYFHTDDENGVARTVTLNGVADVRSTLTVKGHGRLQVNSDGLNGDGTGNITVTDSATLAFASGADLGAGVVTVDVDATMEIASGVNTFGGGLTLNDGATLAFNFTESTVTPQIALPEGKTPTVKGAVKVKIPADSKWPTSGEKILTTCGGFDTEGVTVSLAEGAPKWAKSVYVNEGGNIVLDVKPMGTKVIVR